MSAPGPRQSLASLWQQYATIGLLSMTVVESPDEFVLLLMSAMEETGRQIMRANGLDFDVVAAMEIPDLGGES